MLISLFILIFGLIGFVVYSYNTRKMGFERDNGIIYFLLILFGVSFLLEFLFKYLF